MMDPEKFLQLADEIIGKVQESNKSLEDDIKDTIHRVKELIPAATQENMTDEEVILGCLILVEAAYTQKIMENFSISLGGAPN